MLIEIYKDDKAGLGWFASEKVRRRIYWEGHPLEVWL